MNDILLLFPVWEEETWNALQKKQWSTAAARFSDFVRSLTPEERRGVAWKNVIQGVPAARGELTEDEWAREVRPFLIREFLEFATGRTISDTLNSISAPERIEIFSAFISATPGDTLEAKTQWLGQQKSTSASYFLATPAQCLDAHFPDLDKHIPLELAQRKFVTLPSSLQEEIFSYDTAEIIHHISRENLFNESKIRAAAHAVGHILLGFETPKNAREEIRRAAIIDEKTAETLAREFHLRIFSSLLSDLEEVYEPPEDFKGRAADILPVADSFLRPRASAPAFSPSSSSKPTTAPFVLHKEQSLTPEVKKEFMKGFSLPFGLFKPKTGEDAMTPRVTVEAPKTVHYSEYRSNVAPGSGGEFINLETFGKTRMDADMTPPVKPSPMTPSADKSNGTDGSDIPIKKSEPSPQPKAPSAGTGVPKIEGNTVDLR